MRDEHRVGQREMEGNLCVRLEPPIDSTRRKALAETMTTTNRDNTFQNQLLTDIFIRITATFNSDIITKLDKQLTNFALFF